MGKKEYCLSHETIAYTGFSMCTGIEIHGIEHEIEDYVYYRYYHNDDVSYHKAIIKHTASGRAYFKFNNMRIHLDECIHIS